MRRFFFFALIFAAHGARAELNFTFVDGADVGIEETMTAARSSCVDNGDKSWLWGAAGWSDASGSYLYFAYHGCGPALLFKRLETGMYEDITPPTDVQFEQKNRPLIFDADNNGYLDVIHTNGATRARSLLNNGDGTWLYSVNLRASVGAEKLADVNGDEYPDLIGITTRGTPQGSGSVRVATNLAGSGWDYEDTPVTLPSDAPSEVVARVNAASDRFHMTRIYPFEGSGYVVSYGGGYGGEKFHYLVRNGQVADVGLPQDGTALRPQDLDGDGDLDIVVQHGASSGIYLQNAAGQFSLADSTDGEKTVAAGLDRGQYEWDVWPIDLDEDGDNDLILSSKRSQLGYILENNNGRFDLYFTIHHVDGEPMMPADIDGDGDIDVVVAGQGSSRDPSVRSSTNAALYINQLFSPSDVAPDDPEPEPDRVSLALDALDTAAAAIVDAQLCTVQADTACATATYGAAKQAIMEAQRWLPFQ